MENKIEEYHRLPRWFQRMLPLISIILAALAFAYSRYLYNQPSLEFVHWIRIGVFSVMCVALIISTITCIFNKELAWKWLIGAVTLLPILLMLQLILLFLNVIRMVINSIFEGKLPEPLRVFIENYPSKFDVVILAVLFIVGVLWIIDKLKLKK